MYVQYSYVVPKMFWANEESVVICINCIFRKVERKTRFESLKMGVLLRVGMNGVLRLKRRASENGTLASLNDRKETWIEIARLYSQLANSRS